MLMKCKNKRISLETFIKQNHISKKIISQYCEDNGISIVDFELNSLNLTRDYVVNSIINFKGDGPFCYEIFKNNFKFNVSKDTCYKLCKENNIKICTSNMYHKLIKYSVLYRKGYTTREIAEHEGVAHQNICQLFQVYYGKDWKKVIRNVA